MPDAVSIFVRPAVQGDVGSLADLLEVLFSVEEDFSIDRNRQERGLQMMLDNGMARVLVAADSDGTVVGMCSGQLVVSTAEGGLAVLVEDVVVSRDWRGKGIGSRLMRGIMCWARDNQARRLQLLADRNNGPAFGFYASLGWEATQLVCLRNRIQPS
jgi:GNAT superfamily N-acetyltransferase